MKRTAIWLMILTIVSKCMGFVRDIILANYYGASATTDAYLISMTIPVTLAAFIGMAVSTGYIPLYSEAKARGGQDKADHFTSQVITGVLILCTVLVILLEIFTTPVVKLFASGFEGDVLDMAVRFTRITLLSMFSFGVTYIVKSYLQLKNEFTVPALVGLPFNAVTILFIIISAHSSAVFLAVGGLLAEFSQLVYLAPFLKRKQFSYTWQSVTKDPAIRKMVRLSLPALMGVSVQQINVLVDRTLASRIVEGGITALTYANQLNLFIQGIFVISVCTAAYPILSDAASKRDHSSVTSITEDSLGTILLFVAPAAVGAMLFAEPIVRLLFARGAFGEQAIHMTSRALFYYAIGMLAIGLREGVSRTFYALQNTRTPMVNAAVTMGLNIVLNIVLSSWLGLRGLALATSLAATIGVVLLYIALKRKMGTVLTKTFWTDALKILIALAGMSYVALKGYGMGHITFSMQLRLGLAVLAGGFSYAVLLWGLRVRAFYDILHNLMHRQKG